MAKLFLGRSLLLMAGAAALNASPVSAAVPTYSLVWLGLGNTAGATNSVALDINNQGQVVGVINQVTITPTGANSYSTYTNWSHSAIWTQAGTLADELPNSNFQPCMGISSATEFCPDVNSARAVNDSGLVVGIANIPISNSYNSPSALPSGSGWDHSYYYDSVAKGPMMAVPTTYGTSAGHYDYTTDVNSTGQIIGYMDAAFTGTYWPKVGYIYTPGQAQASALPPPTLLDGSQSQIVYPKAINDFGSVVGTGSRISSSTATATTYSYRPVIWQNSTSPGQEVPGFSLASNMQWSFAQGINNLGQVSGYTQDAADTANLEYARLYDSNTQQTVTLGLGEALHVNAGGWATVTNFQNYPIGGAFVYVPSAPNAQTGQTCRLDVNMVPGLAGGDYLDKAYSINDNGLIVGSGSHNGHTEAFVLAPTAVPATLPTCTPVPFGTGGGTGGGSGGGSTGGGTGGGSTGGTPLSCELTAGASEAAGKGKITEVGAGYIKIGTKKVNYADCTKISFGGYSTSFTVGQAAEWEGFTLNGVTTAKAISVE